MSQKKKTPKRKKAKKNSRETVARSITFYIDTDNGIGKISKLEQYRNNRSAVVDTLVKTNPNYTKLLKKKK